LADAAPSSSLISINIAAVATLKVPSRGRLAREFIMSANVGTIDRIVRVIIGIALIVFALGYIAPGTSWAWVGWIGVVPLLTAVLGTCPLYSVIGCSTK
jgi:sulfite exporter TauE/SafE